MAIHRQPLKEGHFSSKTRGMDDTPKMARYLCLARTGHQIEGIAQENMDETPNGWRIFTKIE